MDIHKFEVFLDLAKTLSYTETAERLFTTQGNISKQILALEKELDTKLFERSHRTIKLTEAGGITAIYAAKIMSEYDAMLRTLNQHAAESENTLTIHAIPSVSNYRGFELIAAFHHKYPEISLHLSEVDHGVITQSLDNGKADVVFGRDFGDINEKYETIVTDKDQFVCVVPKDHPLADATQVKISDLQDEEFLLLGRETTIYNRVMTMARTAGFEPKVAYEGQRIDIILNMIANGMGVSIMMEKSVDMSANPDIIKRPINLNDVSQLAFMRKNTAQHSKASELFWKFVGQNK